MPRNIKKPADFELIKDHLIAILCAKNVPYHLRQGVNLTLFILDFLKQGLPAPKGAQRADFLEKGLYILTGSSKTRKSRSRLCKPDA